MNTMLKVIPIVIGMLLSACEQEPVETTPTIAVAMFGSTGDAESGPYALQLFGLSSAVATELGSRTSWQIMESDRVATLEEEIDYGGQEYVMPDAEDNASEDDKYAALGAGNSLPAAPIEIAQIFPTADFILIGQINGFDVAPVRVSGGSALQSRANRIRTTIEFRVVGTQSRGWVASDTVVLDLILSDDRRAETQVNEFLLKAAQAVATRTLQHLSADLVVEDVQDNLGEQRLRVSGGTEAGIEVGNRYQVATNDLSTGSTTVEILEVFPAHAIARNAGANLAAGATFAPMPLASEVAPSDSLSVVRMAVTPCLARLEAEFADTWFVSVRNRLTTYLQGYHGVQIVDDRPVVRDKLLAQQLLDDLSKGREVGFPLGSLRGVDYLVVCNVESVAVAEPSESKQTVYEVDVTSSQEGYLQIEGSVYVVDVNSGVTVVGEPISVRGNFAADDPKMIGAADRIAQAMFGKLMVSLRPMAVAQATGRQVTVNHKRDIGVKVGEEFEVFAPGSDVTDATTGEILINVGGSRIGRMRVTGFDVAGWIQGEMVAGGQPLAGYLLRPVDTSDDASESNEDAVW